jgi:2-oxoglutarate dehydrogenase E1 component
MDKYSYLSNGDVDAIEELYKKFKENPDSVDDGWRKFFEGFEFSKTNYEEQGTGATGVPENYEKEFKVKEIIEGYRARAHLLTTTRPVR